MAVLKKYTLLFFVFISIIACNKDVDSGCFTRVGDLITEEREIDGNFSSLAIYDNAVVNIKIGPEIKVVVRGGEKLISSYTTQVEGNKLVLENKTICKWSRNLSTPFEVTITMPEIDSILYYGYGALKSVEQLEMDDLNISVFEGSGKIDLDLKVDSLALVLNTGVVNPTIKGSANYVYAYCVSQSIVDMSDFNVTRGYYVCSGTGDFRINTSDYIKVKLDLTGNLYYTNDPEIYVESQEGSGQLIPY